MVEAAPHLGGLEAFRSVYGEDPSPDSISAAASDPARSAERLVEEWRTSSPSPHRLPALAPGELRPLLAQRDSLPISMTFGSAEHEINRLTGVLLYAHEAVLFDPISHLETSLEIGEMNVANLLGPLHLLAFSTPLVEAGVVRLVPPPAIQGGRQYQGPWPSRRFRSYKPAHFMRRLEKKRGWFKNVESELKPSRNMLDRVIGRNAAIRVVQQTNAMKGRAHLLRDENLELDVAYDEEAWFDRLLLMGVLKGMFRGELQKLIRLVQHPLPDFSVVRADDLIALRQRDRFGDLRHQLGESLESYEIGIGAGRGDVGAGLASEFRRAAEALEEEVKASSVLTAARKGFYTLAVTGAAAAATLPLQPDPGATTMLAAPASAAAAELVRALVAVRSKRHMHAALVAHASAARAAAERFRFL
jgi:hypothetical protein